MSENLSSKCTNLNKSHVEGLNKAIAEEFTEARTDIYETQEGLAKTTQLSRQTIYRFESGEHNISLAKALIIADALHISIEDMVIRFKEKYLK